MQQVAQAWTNQVQQLDQRLGRRVLALRRGSSQLDCLQLGIAHIRLGAQPLDFRLGPLFERDIFFSLSIPTCRVNVRRHDPSAAWLIGPVVQVLAFIKKLTKELRISALSRTVVDACYEHPSGKASDNRQNKPNFFHGWDFSFLSMQRRKALWCLLASAASQNHQREQNADDDANLDPVTPIGRHGWDSPERYCGHGRLITSMGSAA